MSDALASARPGLALHVRHHPRRGAKGRSASAVVASATGGKQLSAKSLQRKPKVWLQQELASRGVEAKGTKAELAKQLVELWAEDSQSAEAAGDAKSAPGPRQLAAGAKAPQPGLMTKEQLLLLRVVDLKAKLSELDLPKSGVKLELIERLLAAVTPRGARSDESPRSNSSTGEVDGPAASNEMKGQRTPSKVPARTESKESLKKTPPPARRSRQRVSPAESANSLRSQVDILRREVMLREVTLKDLTSKLEAAEQSQRLDRQMLAGLQSSMAELLEQQSVWQASLRKGKLKQLQDEVARVEDKLRPDLEQQLAELQELAHSLEKESSLKEEMVNQLTASLNRSFSAPSASKGLPDLDRSSGLAEGDSQVQLAAASSGFGQERAGRPPKSGLGGIGVALAAGVIAVLDGLSLSQSMSKDSVPKE